MEWLTLIGQRWKAAVPHDAYGWALFFFVLI
jgi:hypothetical protein